MADIYVRKRMFEGAEKTQARMGSIRWVSLREEHRV